MISVKETCSDTLTNASGYALFLAMKSELETSSLVDVSFENTNGLSSSFLNSSFGALVETFGKSILAKIKPCALTGSQAVVLRKFSDSLKKQRA